MKRAYGLVLLACVLVLGSVLINYGTVASAPQPPFPQYHVVPVNNILYPRLITPYFVIYGEQIDVWVKKTADMPSDVDWSVALESVFTENWKYPLEKVDQGFDSNIEAWWITVEITEGIPPGLYNLTVSGAGLSFTEPNSVYVFGAEYPDRITAIHFTDTHYGTRDLPKHHTNQRLFREIVAVINGLRPDVALHTGDLIDAIVRPDEEDPFRQAYLDLVRLRVPIVAAQGNNDHTAVEKKAYYWEKYFGPFYAVVKIGRNFRFVTLDTDTGRVYSYQFDLVESLLTEDSGIGVILQHYPLMDQDLRVWLYGPDGKFQGTLEYEETVQKILDVAKKAKAPLILTGHWHSDDAGLFDGVTCLVSEAGQYDHEDDFGHYRPINLSANGTYWYAEVSSSVAKLGAEYLQASDGSSTGVAIKVWNKLDQPVTLTLPVVLSSYSPSPTVEGAEVVASYGSSGKGAYELSVTVAPGEEKIVKVYVQPDGTPPSVKAEVVQLTDGRYEIKPEVSDEGLGVLEYRVFISTDNTTWTPLEPEIETGWPLWRVSPDQATHFKIEAVDAAGNSAEYYGTLKVAPPTTTPAPAPGAPGLASNIVLWIAGIIVVAIALLAALRRGKS